MDERVIHLLRHDESHEARQQILIYFEELKKQDEGWQLCGDILAKNLYEDEKVKFFCLQVLESHIKKRYTTFSLEQQLLFKSYLQQWYSQCCQINHKNFIRNKSAQLFCLLFVLDYPKKWPDFFSNMLSLLDHGPLAVDAFLRNLVAIDEEVVSRHIPHTEEEFQRNTDIKDYMREDCVNDLVEAWYQILILYEQKQYDLICLCLKVIGAYVSWIDINLIANDKFINCILAYMNVKELRESACECLLEIINKGMDAGPKTRLVESLSVALEKSQVLCNDKEDSKNDEDIDFIIKLSSLMNGMGVQLITSLNKLDKDESANALKVEILQAIDNKVPHMLRFLSDNDDDVSEAMFEFCHAYLGMLKQYKNQSICSEKYIKDLLLVVINKMKFDEEFDFENEGDDEADFLEFRKQMKVLMGNIAKLDGLLVMNSIAELVVHTLSKWRNLCMEEVEVAIYVLYCLGEAFPGLQLYNEADKSEKFHQVMSLLLTSEVSQHQHSAVRLQYFETITRYERFFYTQSHHIPNALISYLDERGLRNLNAAVSSRTCFLFMRFIKSLKNQITPYVDDILKRLDGLLVSNQDANVDINISEQDRYYLYELAAILITCSNTPPDKQRSMMESLLSPIVNLFQQYLDKLTNGNLDEVGMQALALQLNHLVSYASRASKAFSSVQGLKSSGCAPCFTEGLNIFLHALTIQVHRDIIHNAVRQYLHRMIICLGEDVLPYIPIAVTHLLKDCQMRDIQEFIPLINQLVTRFKTGISPFLSSILMPLVTQIFALIQANVDPNDLQALKEKQLLQRSYFLFITTIVNASLVDVIAGQEASNFKEILLSLVHGAVEIPDPQGQKNCFVIFHKLLDCWGHNENFKEFIYDHIIPSCFMAPLKPTFDLNDAQTILVLQEIANTLKTTLTKRGVELIQWLQQSYLPQNNCPNEIIEEYSHALQTMDGKQFKNYLKAFYSRWKT